MKSLLYLAVLMAVACGTANAPAPPAPESTSGSETPAEPEGPKVVGQEVTYEAGGVPLKGYIAWDENKPGKRPGVVVVHEWWGHNEYVRERARQLAALGYTALAIDMYGEGKNTTHPADAQKFMEAAISDKAVAMARFEAGLELLKAHETVNPEKTAAIGYCFGGAVVLHAARKGADLDAVVSFHGALGTDERAEPGDITARVLVLTGEADPMVPKAQVEALRKELTEAGAEFEIVSYPGAMHAFTNPGATELGKATGVPIAYNAAADADSFARMEALFKEIFSQAPLTPEQAAARKQTAKNRGDIARLEAAAQTEADRLTPEVRAAAKKLAETSYPSTAAGLNKILKSPHRAPENIARDKQRHPKQTLTFLGLKPTMTVFEYGPGAGWYTEILAPLLSPKGKLIVNNGDANGPVENRGTYYAKRTKLFLDSMPELYGNVDVITIADPKAPTLGLDGTLDMALVVRGYHGWINTGTTNTWLSEIHKALKPKGILAIVQHRGTPGADATESAKQGYVPQDALIKQVEAAGFKLVGKSEVNANPKDTHDHPRGVWTLPPTLSLGEQDKDKYEAIGESDRMTLKFVRVDAPAPAE